MPRLDQVLELFRQGYNVVPIYPREKRVALDTWKELQERRVTEEELREWWGRRPDLNVGIVTGAISGIVVVDVDRPEILEECKLPPTRMVRTPGGGYHLYYRHPGNRVRNRVNVRPGVDIRGDGGYVVAPPSVLEYGAYEWVNPETPLADFPQWLIAETSGSDVVQEDEEEPWYEELLQGVPEGERDNAAIRLVGRWVRRGLSDEEIVSLLLDWNRRNKPPMGDLPGDPPLDRWVREKIASARRMEEGRRARTPQPEEALRELETAEDENRRLSALHKLARALEGKPLPDREYYVELARKASGLTKPALRKILQFAADGGARGATPTPLEAPRRPNLALAQDYYDGVLHYGVWLPTHPKAAGQEDYVFKLVRSDRRLEDPPEVVGLPIDTARWSVDRQTPYNVFEWLQHSRDLDARELLRELVEVFEEYIWYPRENTSLVLALWVMSTYVYMCFDRVSYIALTGSKRSGKSRTLELLEQLCFNALPAGSVSAAALFRSIEANRSTVLLDESDILSLSPAVAQGGVDERLSALLNGYQKGKKFFRVEGDKHTPKGFDVYSPKAFASMNKLPDPLADRAIAIKVGRRPLEVKIGDLVMAEQASRFQVLRNKLYFFGLTYADRLVVQQHEVIDLLKRNRITDRECEIWLVPALIALELGGPELFRKVVDYALLSICDKRGQEQTTYTNAVIWACWTLLKHGEEDEEIRPVEVNRHGEWYLRKTIRELVARYLGVDVQQVSAERIGRELVATGIIENTSSYRKQLGVKRYRGERAYLLLKERVADAARRYELEELAELWEGA